MPCLLTFVAFPSANNFGQKRAEQWWVCAVGEALEVLQNDWPVRIQVGQKISACGCERLCGMAMCVKKPFADKPFDYFWAKK